MTVDSEIYMPKSKAPKMDDLDYSKHLKSLFQFAIAKGANASAVATRMFICFNMA